MASGIVRGRVRTRMATRTATMTESRNIHGGHSPNNRLTETCSLSLPSTSLILVSVDLCRVNISRAQVYCSSTSYVFLKLTKSCFFWLTC